MPETLAQNIKTFIAERYQTKLEEKQKAYDKNKAAAVTAEDFDRIESQFLADKEKLLQQFELNAWIDNAARRANQISMATHALKFTNSSAKGSNVLAHELGHDARYLDTEIIQEKAIDAVGNAAALDVARFLQLTDENGLSLLSYLAKADHRPLALIAKSDEELTHWLDGLKQALRDTSPSSHVLGKQIYFPISDNEYHLLAPLYSSSLAQVLFDAVQYSRFSQEMKVIREAKRHNDFHPQPLIAYPNLAVTVSGGSKPQNVSQLNNKRSGKTYLFSAAPPNWQVQNKPPLGLDSILQHRDIYYHTQEPITRLTQFLIKLNTASTESNMRIRHYIVNTVDEVIDQILLVAAKWQQLPAGWSDKSDLPLAQRRWLDPNNSQWDRFDDHWQQVIAENVGLWLKDKVNKGSQNHFTLGQIEAMEWQKQCLNALQEIA
ncbi:type I-F CRISPR-associated protein Csy1 [Photobacterium damselae]|uniref:type I-F CRISPR-associated protein Csy1 n=1 Tax=Photobacterium damselae TaxID=38293 RepID=UPI002341DA88|nr:type I-F CRISPR-associated protein Csy1 [Photobacterium damselae]MDC4170189.1 type I-F CRISPR-associated protein Csy1 [Photobacterium damselae]